MTRTHALFQLLRHGALTSTEIREITGWTARQVGHAIDALLNSGRISTSGVRRRYVYDIVN